MTSQTTLLNRIVDDQRPEVLRAIDLYAFQISMFRSGKAQSSGPVALQPSSSWNISNRRAV